MDTTAELLARGQFAFTVSFHIIFPTLTIGLAVFLAVLEGLWLKTQALIYYQHFMFWRKLFAMTFGMGVVSGVALSYEFGTNFSEFSRITGNVLGPLMGYEILSAFFLEAGFLGIMLFGWQRVSARVHFFATCMVALGTTFSAFWILAANSWMHTPAGFAMDGDQFIVSDWWAVIFNPSFPYRLCHMILAALSSSSFFILGVSAILLLRTNSHDFARYSFKLALFTLLGLMPLQILVGDLHGLNVAKHQPIKLAAMEGIWHTDKEVPLLLFAIPDQEQETNHFEIGIPKLASLLIKHDTQATLEGLTAVDKADRPNVATVFFAFRIMLAAGFLMFFISYIGAYLYYRKKIFNNVLYLKICRAAIPLGVIATLAGWVVAETGRQPWTVYGLLRTSDSVSPVPADQVALSFTLFVICYSILSWIYLHFMRQVINQGPQAQAPETRVSTHALGA